MSDRLQQYEQQLISSFHARDRGDIEAEDEILADLDQLWIGFSEEERELSRVKACTAQMRYLNSRMTEVMSSLWTLRGQTVFAEGDVKMLRHSSVSQYCTLEPYIAQRVVASTPAKHIISVAPTPAKSSSRLPRECGHVCGTLAVV